MDSGTIHRRRALVTGATGFVGSHLVRRLVHDGWDTYVIARRTSKSFFQADGPNLKIEVHDGSSEQVVRMVGEAKPTVVFHLASLFLAEHGPGDVEGLINSNVLFGTQLVEAMAVSGCRHLINAGTSWQHYGDAVYDPVNLYAATKQAFEDILMYYVKAYGMRAITLSLFDTYGPNDTRPKLMTLLWKSALSREPLAMSPGDQFVDLVYIDDVIDAFILAADLVGKQSEGHSRYGVSSGAPMRLRDLVATFEKVSGLNVHITWGAKPYRRREVMRPWSTYQLVPGWKPKVLFEQGVRLTQPPLSA